MIVHPTTEQLLLDCARELREGVLPALTDHTAIVRTAMVEQVLRNTAVRSAHEIQWMRDEITALTAYVHEVAAASSRPELSSGLHGLSTAHTDHLHLVVVSDRYRRASELFAAALEVTVDEGLDALREQGERLLDARLARERQVMAGWSPTGR
ncbi:MAG: hypothetical protein JWN08_3836 [Frankiales bacterium]|nr:hypothetical protein [Frankiales bacterium]